MTAAGSWIGVNHSTRDLMRRAWRIYRPINFAIWLLLSLSILAALIWKATGHGKPAPRVMPDPGC